MHHLNGLRYTHLHANVNDVTQKFKVAKLVNIRIFMTASYFFCSKHPFTSTSMITYVTIDKYL